ncbi:hypothetical protein BJY14_002574 [Actinomadura luteofluorescens]|uniref:Uncharacterized protein n=1 Tax=Actinomadura luteofluorescens TaxID=46163 RepID=A0A7Y9EFI3_9ACTN|nr:hypothetical protein [Actinomadura luteofluorescens]NYD46591.1 hypothetical protein [Actinomadura luteofluorescens]
MVVLSCAPRRGAAAAANSFYFLDLRVLEVLPSSSDSVELSEPLDFEFVEFVEFAAFLELGLAEAAELGLTEAVELGLLVLLRCLCLSWSGSHSYPGTPSSQ